MSATKVKGIVLKYCNMNDNDRLFTLFCPGMGKVSALSKGIRSHRHKDFAALQPFCYSEFVIDTSKRLAYISSAQVLENFFDLRTSVEKMSLAAYITDLVSALSDEIIYDDEFFRFTLNTLFMVSKSSETDKTTLADELLKLKTIYELKAVCTAGYMPQTGRCIICGNSKELEYFDIYNGGSVCKSCAEKGLSPEFVKTLHSVGQMVSFICNSDNRTVFKFNASADIIHQCSHISEMYLVNKLEIVSGQLEYFKNIINI